MKYLLMAVAVLAGPGLWALAVHWLLLRIWPDGARSAWTDGVDHAAPEVGDLLDYQT